MLENKELHALNCVRTLVEKNADREIMLVVCGSMQDMLVSHQREIKSQETFIQHLASTQARFSDAISVKFGGKSLLKKRKKEIVNEEEKSKFNNKIASLLNQNAEYTQKELSEISKISKETWSKFLKENKVEHCSKDKNTKLYKGIDIINALIKKNEEDTSRS